MPPLAKAFIFSTSSIHTAGGPGTSITSLERLLVAALAEIVGAGVGHYSALYIYPSQSSHSPLYAYQWIAYAYDALRPNELDEAVLNRALGIALTIGLDIAQVADVAGLVCAVTVGLAVRVD
ncbi:hypothetical protein NUW58_g7998 [Xylaria curta]|uniref:Uncharacterized protein n=1 Tax=Xylaria curta TaxID=42375 RepID=A0ACC1NDB7_9PEZI|nr:hypothetical protein NUW58_g7998 [Xylaria curta]